jgi:predicted nucleic acid-binding protein
MMWVIDASVAVRWFLKNEVHPNANKILHSIINHPGFFAVPDLFCFEVFAVLGRLHPSPVDAYINGILPIIQGGILRQPMSKSLASNSGLMIKKGLTGYDAVYAALAKEIKGKWLTFDKKAHHCIKGEGISHLITEKLPDNWDGIFKV